jgi:hypothetical protein
MLTDQFLTQLFNPFLNSTLPVADRRTSHKAPEHCSEVLGAAEAQRKGNVCHRISTVSKLYAGRINLSAQDVFARWYPGRVSEPNFETRNGNRAEVRQVRNS